MSQENVEDLIRASYESLNREKGGSTEDWWHADGEFINAREDPDHATHRGVGAIRAQAEAWFDAFPDLRVEPMEIRANGDRAFVWTHMFGHGADSGIAMDMELAQVFTLEGGRIRRIEEYFDRAEAFEAAGLNVEVVRKPLRLREQSSRTLEQRLGIRFPWLVAKQASLLARLPPGSRLRKRMVWRGTRLGMEAFNRRDVDAAVLAGHADFEMNPPREYVEVGFFEPSYRGTEGFRKYVSTWSEVLGAELEIQPTELIDLGDRVVLLANLAGRAQASGVPFTGKIATVSTLKGGKATRVQMYLDHAEALAAVGLSE